MPAASGWRSPRAAGHYEDHDLADFAQEFLSRNHDYRREYKEAQLRVAARRASRQTEMEGLARRWGLSFPLRSRHRGAKLAGTLVA